MNFSRETMKPKDPKQPRRRQMLYLIAIAANLIPFVLCFAWGAGSIADPAVAVAIGGFLTVLGIVLTFLFRAKWEGRRLPWGISLCILGAAKGSCAAALYLSLNMTASGFFGNLQLAICAAGLAFFVGAALSLLFGMLREKTAARILSALLPLLCVVAAIVLLASRRELFFGLLLLNLLTDTVCASVLWLESDDRAEAQFILSTASMLYAIALFLVALFAVSDGDCCDGADCGGCGGGGDGKSKKRR